ncbi:MAG: dicarboxylate/amino acid:cation symporter [Pseudomonadota bacterium]
MAWWFQISLWKRVFLGLIFGVGFGLAVTQIMGPLAGEALLLKVKVIGDVFIRLIRMIVVPLIFFTLTAGIYAMGDPKKLGTIGIKAFALYLVTTFFANIIGLSMGLLFRPGAGVDLGDATPRSVDIDAPSVGERLMGIIPENPFMALVQGDVLAVIFFSLLLGVGILTAREKGEPAGRFFEAASEAILKVTYIIMELAPFGVFALIAYVAGTKGVETFTAILTLTIAVYLGAAIHMLLVYGGLVRIVLGLPLVNFFRGILEAMMVAYSTSSSSATLPVTIRAVSENLGVDKPVAGSVLPLGATINMDGTSLYLGIVALFTAQAFGYTLEPYHYGMIALTCALVSIGTAGIPSASLFLLSIVLTVFDVTPEHTALVVGFIFPFDRLLDMMRTVVNVTGDAAVATAVAKWEGEIDEKVYRSKISERA